MKAPCHAQQRLATSPQFEAPRPRILRVGHAHDEALALQLVDDLHGPLIGYAKTLAQLPLVERSVRDCPDHVPHGRPGIAEPVSREVGV